METIELIKLIFIVIAALLAYIQYWSANKFKRSQYLSELWRKFYTTESLTNIFQALERRDKRAFDTTISPSDVYSYLAYLEEVVIFVKNNPMDIHKISRKEVLNLFQFHFYYVYQLEETKKIFWSGILSENEDIDTEIKSFYWKQQYDFSLYCKEVIEQGKQA